jgi:parallel beta-helix repeat protein
VIRHNFFSDSLGFGKDSKGAWVSPHFAWGVYLDDNTGGVDVIGNIVARCARAGLHLHNGRDNLIENNIFIEGGLYQYEYSGWTKTHPYWTNHLPSMIKGHDSVIGQPAWQKMRNIQTRPEQAVLPNGMIMTGNVFRRNLLYYRNPKPALLRMGSVPFDHNEFDNNLAWHFGQPLLTGQWKIKGVQGPNLAPNAGFEEGEPGRMPKGWQWQVRPKDSMAALDAEVQAAGKQSVRVEGRGTTSDGRQTLSPNFVSEEIPVKPGQTYRLTARIKAAAADTKFAMMPQSYIANVYFWAKDLTTAAGTDWKDYEIVFKFPGPGDSNYREEMKSIRIRFDVRQDAGTLWLDEVTLHEAIALNEWESWQALRLDTHSLVADPLFVNADKDDYRLRKDSPAFKLGFHPIPVEKIGPYKHELRASWPIVEAEGAREKPVAQANHRT